MDHILAKEGLSTQAVAEITNHIAQRANISAQLIDRAGRIIATNQRGLDLLGSGAADVFGQHHGAVWTTDTDAAGQDPVAAAFAGRSVTFAGHPQGAPSPHWTMEALPLEHDGAEVATVLLLATPAGDTTPDAAPDAGLRDLMHKLANLTSISLSAARLLQRGVDTSVAASLAAELETAATETQDALEGVRSLLGEL
ncbi:hypothetical protein ATO6_18375 [Oceanicola sp. 22II-s10i]|uniref:PAS domain-containing protein n=1 Tax=Oceanicola sp. 22II-s10i TaxID=1317116 RepID=UPI000B5277EA|nr:PAS domain-containing protein [Oceanicola sp. 22II-s10i]OWU83418.1 hypothetical protein ATO6_18375 [Oceanicola sp. 22II-s10i]